MVREEDPSHERPRAAPDPELEALLDVYLQELADGRAPDREALLRDHPSQAESLRGVFRTLDFVQAAGRSMRTASLGPGDTLGEFRIVGELGRGGMGVVYEAEQESVGRRVALKVLAPGALLSSAALSRFRRETAAAGELQHPNIVAVWAAGEEDGSPYYAMQLVEGRSLAEFVEARRAAGQPPDAEHFRRVARWAERVADALACAHAHGIVHRDVKPSNLLLDAAGQVYVSDFGLARLDAQATVTATGDVVGTPRYMSPEQALGHDVDARTDVYSLGATLYELVCLEPPFPGDSREEVLGQVVRAEPVPLRRRGIGCPADLAAVVERCMAREVADRYPSARELADDLARFVAGDATRARRSSKLRRPIRWLRRRPLQLATAALAIVLVAWTAVSVAGARREEGRRPLDEATTLVLFDGAYGRAARLLDEAEARGVDGSELGLLRGLLCAFGGPSQDAAAQLEAVLERSPGDAEARLALAYAQIRTGDFARGRETLDSVPPERIDSALGWFLHGLTLSQFQGSTAIESFDRAIARSRDFVPAIHSRAFYRGSCLLADGCRDQLQPMLDDYGALVVFRPSSYSHALRAIGWLAAAAYAGTQPDLVGQREGWLARCRTDVDRALELRTRGDSTALMVQGELEWFTGCYAKAVEAFAEAVAVERDSGRTPRAEIEFFSACAQHAVGELEAALLAIEAANDRSPAYYPLAVERSLLLAELGRLEDARDVCAQMVERHRRNATALCLGLGVLDLLQGTKFEEAWTSLALSGADLTSEHVAGDTAQRGLRFLGGDLDAERLLSGADSPGARCELALLVGLRHLGRGDRDAARAALVECVATGVQRFGEHRFAKVLLQRLDTEPGWPAWCR